MLCLNPQVSTYCIMIGSLVVFHKFLTHFLLDFFISNSGYIELFRDRRAVRYIEVRLYQAFCIQKAVDK